MQRRTLHVYARSRWPLHMPILLIFIYFNFIQEDVCPFLIYGHSSTLHHHLYRLHFGLLSDSCADSHITINIAVAVVEAASAAATCIIPFHFDLISFFRALSPDSYNTQSNYQSVSFIISKSSMRCVVSISHSFFYYLLPKLKIFEYILHP